MTNVLSDLPRTDAVLDALEDLPWSRAFIKRAVGLELDVARGRVRDALAAGERAVVPGLDSVVAGVRDRLEAWTRVSPRRVINATGIVLHTNLGRAPLSASARAAMLDAAGACDLEFDLDSGRRGSRFSRLVPLLAASVGAADAHVVNNGAAALLLACTALGGSVAISRGHLVEIGDGFRIATMAAAGGAELIEVGSTNRTHVGDFAAAIDAGASVLLWVHQSNFSQSGFVEHVALAELSALARARGVVLVADLGSGSMGGDLPTREPTIADYLDGGADLVTCSGDKLLGGPQAGIVAGRRDLVERCRRFPMARALRPDKTTLAALHATVVAHCRAGPTALPLHEMVCVGVDVLRTRADALAARLGWGDAVRSVSAAIGGGSLPGDEFPSIALAVPSSRVTYDAARLRRVDNPLIPVVARVHHDELLVDLRTVDPAEDEALATTLEAVFRVTDGTGDTDVTPE